MSQKATKSRRGALSRRLNEGDVLPEFIESLFIQHLVEDGVVHIIIGLPYGVPARPQALVTLPVGDDVAPVDVCPGEAVVTLGTLLQA